MDTNSILAIGLTFISVTLPAAVSVYIMLHKILNVLQDLKELSGKLIESEEKHYDKLAARIQRLEDDFRARNAPRHG